MTLHPSEWYVEDCNVSVIELQREVILDFRVERIHGMRIFSTRSQGTQDGHGWFSSINNRTSVMFAVVNDPSVVKVVECAPILYDWTNTSPKNWGTTYRVTTAPIRFVLNSRYKPQIEEYEMEGTDAAFSVLLKTASIEYFDAGLGR